MSCENYPLKTDGKFKGDRHTSKYSTQDEFRKLFDGFLHGK